MITRTVSLPLATAPAWKTTNMDMDDDDAFLYGDEEPADEVDVKQELAGAPFQGESNGSGRAVLYSNTGIVSDLMI
jgi:hypothetical protein